MEDNEELIAQIAAHYKQILQLIGEDPERDGLKKTPRRAAKALLDVTRGYKQDASAINRHSLSIPARR